jgi:hypothetical protein
MFAPPHVFRAGGHHDDSTTLPLNNDDSWLTTNHALGGDIPRRL